MIDHVVLNIADLERSRRFYEKALAPVGYASGPTFPQGIGFVRGRPGLRLHYHPNYYGAFVLDPDGNNIEAVCHKAE